MTNTRPNAKKPKPTKEQALTIRKPQEAAKPIYIETRRMVSLSKAEHEALIAAEKEQAREWNDSASSFFSKLIDKE